MRRLASAAKSGDPPDDTRPEAIVVADGDMEVSRIRSHRRGHLVSIKMLRKRDTLVELDATVGTQGTACRTPASNGTGGGWPATRSTGSSSNGKRPATRISIRRSACTARRRSATTSCAAGWRASRETAWSRSGAGAPRAILVAHPSSAAGAPAIFAGQIDGEAPVDSIVAILDTLADLVEASIRS